MPAYSSSKMSRVDDALDVEAKHRERGHQLWAWRAQAGEVHSMRLCNLQMIEKLADVPVFTTDDDAVSAFCDPSRLIEIAEAVDTHRLFDLLHRDEYRPIGIVRFDDGGHEAARVYFQCREFSGEKSRQKGC